MVGVAGVLSSMLEVTCIETDVKGAPTPQNADARPTIFNFVTQFAPNQLTSSTDASNAFVRGLSPLKMAVRRRASDVTAGNDEQEVKRRKEDDKQVCDMFSLLSCSFPSD